MMRNFRRIGPSSVLTRFGLLLAGCGAIWGQVNLYVPNNNNAPPNLSEFTINTGTGALTPVNTQATTTTDDNPTRVAMTPNNQYLYVTNGNGFVDAYSVGPSGFLTVIKAQPGYAVPLPIGLAATNNFLYVASPASNQISVFSIGSGGTLTGPLTCAACGTGAGSFPVNVVVDPTGSFIYVTLNGTHQVGVGTIATSGPNAGTITSFNAAAYTGGSSFAPEDLVLTPTGTGLYVSDHNLLPPTFGSSVYGFAVTGATLGTPNVYSTGTASTPNGLAMDPTGRFLFSANQSTNSVSAFTVGAGGTLTPVAGSPFAAGTQPTGASVEPTGKYLYVSNQSDGTVKSYAITQSGATAGALTLVNTVATGTGPYYLLAHLVPAVTGVPASSTWSLAGLGILLAGISGLLYRKAYR